MPLSWLIRVLALLSAILVTGGGASASPGSNLLMSAASDEYIWFVVDAPQGDDRLMLAQHALAMDGPYFARGPLISRMPEAMAASGNRVWIVFPPRIIGDDLRREVFTIQSQRDAGIGMYTTVPRDRLALVEALPGWGRLAGFAAPATGGRGGPVALLLPLEHEKLHVQRDGRPETATQVRTPHLFEMHRDRWHQADLPEAIEFGRHVHLSFDGHDPPRLHVLADYTHFLRLADGTWESAATSVDLASVRNLTVASGRLAMVAVDPDAEQARLNYVRGQRSIALSEVAVPQTPWALLGVRDGFRLLSEVVDESRQRIGSTVAMQVIDPVYGEPGQPQVMTDQPLPAARLWHTGLMLAVAVAAVLIVFAVRPGARSDVKLPENAAVLAALPRLMALLMDLAPGAVLAMLFFAASPVELLRLPMMSESIDQSGPHLLMLAIAFAHCTVLELLKGTSLGKLLVGARVVSITGGSGAAPKPAQVLARNMVKLMILLVPPLAIFALLNPYMQGFNDLAARTLVVQEVEQAAEEEQE